MPLLILSLILVKSVWSQQDCAYSMRFFDVDECERFKTPFVQTTIIADGNCRGQSTGRAGPGPYYRAVCGNNRIFFLAANCRDSECSDCEQNPRFTNNFDGSGWTPISMCHPLPESAYSFNIKSGSCDPSRCAVPARFATPVPTPAPRSPWPTWYEPTPSPTTPLPSSVPSPTPSEESSLFPSIDPTSSIMSRIDPPSSTQTPNASPESPSTATYPAADDSAPIESISSSSFVSHAAGIWTMILLALSFRVMGC